MDMKGDKHGYLRKTGAIPQQKCAVSAKAVAVSGSTRGKGSLGSASDSSATPSKAKIEPSESAHYEKLEKRSLRSLKEGGSEKELRRGHNSIFDSLNPFGGSSGPSKAAMRAQKMKRNVRQVAKSGTTVDAAKNPVLAAKVERRQAVTAARASGEKGAVKAARAAAAPSVKAAKTERKAFSGAEKRESAKSYHATVKEAKKTNRMNAAKRTM